ncbi:MAG: bifunctional DNA-formamidopyrimidine glycosylase/DNA-(apurinic or apyrimidinic site) lyase [Chloroflexi bacterium]|nr:bifunctional DNA-formamidopyrimidine glycosylase/DNA-(apurinic or apyrimidinic site) lyase [Chloroflexota bacterium]
MPELPEVETIARDLQHALVGDTIAAVEVYWPQIVATPTPEEFAARLVGQTVQGVVRRGKFLVLRLTEGTLILHLRMTGQLLWDPDGRRPLPAVRGPSPDSTPAAGAPAACADPHVHLVLRMRSGATLCYRDVRKFGRFYLVADPQAVLGRLGPEPLDEALTPQRLHERLVGRRRRLKDLLLDQAFLAGLGNIYVDEALWEARLSPRRVASTLRREESERLHAALRTVLSRAIDARGTTFSDYRDARDRPGENQRYLAVYGRRGQPCPRCGTPVERDVVAGRGTHYCPCCQAEPAAPKETPDG